MSQQDGFGNNGTEPTGPSEPEQDDDHMQKQSEHVMHVTDRIRLKLQEFTELAEFATHTCLFCLASSYSAAQDK